MAIQGEAMVDNGSERRRYTRIYFSREEEVTGSFSLPGEQEAKQAKILNLSEGGLFFILVRDNGRKPTVGETVKLREMAGPPPFSMNHELDMEVRWISDVEAMENIGYGCEFIEPPPASVRELRQIVDAFLDRSM